MGTWMYFLQGPVSSVFQGSILIFKKKSSCKIRFIKQFVVKNCSKERSGSIITETLKIEILIPIVTSKGLHFDADLQYKFHQV